MKTKLGKNTRSLISIHAAIALLVCQSVSAQNKSSKLFEEFKKNPSKATLLDYSWAGYKMGTEEIPTAQGKIFDVTQYGALPNDELEDFDGVQAAILAAEQAGGGIVFFPKGRFLMNEKVGRRDGIKISKANIILKGSGREPGGTELFMKNYLLPKDSTKKWTVPYLFTFDYYQGKKDITKISADAKRGSFSIEVADASKLKVGDFVSLKMQNVAANPEFLDGLETWTNWKTTNNKGVSINERHKIAKIEGNTIVFIEPLKTDITASYDWTVMRMPLSAGLGVEDIWFRGNFKEEIVHHKDFIHDAGWSMIAMQKAENGFIRRIRFTDVCSGMHLSNCYATSVLHIRFDGNPGHATTGAVECMGLLFGFIHDATEKPGMWHGPCVANSSSGNVLWRYLGQERSGPDYHASWPYATLIDASTSVYIGNGGNVDLLPNHLKDLVYWNHNFIGKYDYVDFWETQNASDPSQNKDYGNFAKIVKPIFVGNHGDKVKFEKSNLKINESEGMAVSPESLYEAQLELRLSKIPDWISKAKTEWEVYLKESVNWK